MSEIMDFIENKDLNLDQTQKYAAILGESPSKGARSPKLWNAVFEKLNLSCVMHPMDIVPDNLEVATKALREDEKFIGGAVTMPYKIDILPFLDALEPEAEIIGAVNCLYKEDGKLIGTNTDGAGALWSLENSYGQDLQGKTVFLIGTGGAGIAVATYIASSLGEDGKLIIANRSRESRRKAVQKLQSKCQVESLDSFPISAEQVTDVDIIINCTSVGFETLKNDEKGFYSLKGYAPLAEVDDTIRVEGGSDAEERYFQKAQAAIEKNVQSSKEVLSQMKEGMVFDIIYQPLETKLLSLAKESGKRTLNGLAMNLEQAVIAFVKASSSANLYNGEVRQVREIMQKE